MSKCTPDFIDYFKKVDTYGVNSLKLGRNKAIQEKHDWKRGVTPSGHPSWRSTVFSFRSYYSPDVQHVNPVRNNYSPPYFPQAIYPPFFDENGI